MRIFLLFVLIMPTASYAFWGDSCRFEGTADGKKIYLNWTGKSSMYGLKNSKIYGTCTVIKRGDYQQNYNLSCAATTDGNQTVYYETNVIEHAKTAEEANSAITYVCKSGCKANIVQIFMLRCEPD